jgi:hypothetical protein
MDLSLPANSLSFAITHFVVPRTHGKGEYVQNDDTALDL